MSNAGNGYLVNNSFSDRKIKIHLMRVGSIMNAKSAIVIIFSLVCSATEVMKLDKTSG